MNASEYQKLASRTECDQERSRQRMFGGHISASYSHDDTCRRPIRVNHAVIGLMGEVGELAAALEKWIYYGQDLDLVNVGEEVGDCLWYLSLLLNATGMSMSTIMEANISKLKKRYPERYTDERAAAENRDREAERKTLEEIYPPSLPSYDPQQECEARQQADEEAELEGNVGRELEKQVMKDISSRPVGKEVTDCLNRHEDPTGQSQCSALPVTGGRRCWLFRHHIVSTFARWAVRQSPVPVPVHLEQVLWHLDQSLALSIKWDARGMALLDGPSVENFIRRALWGYPPFMAWNEPMTKTLHPTNGTFIDLDALLRNVCMDLDREMGHEDRPPNGLMPGYVPETPAQIMAAIGEVGKSVVAGHTHETVALGVPTPRDWLCACWDGTSGTHINPPYDTHCGRCGRRRTPAPMTYPTLAEMEQEMQARGSPLSRMPYTWQCLACQQVNNAGNTYCVYCGKTTLKEAPSTGPHSSHDWYSFSSNPIYHRCRKCGTYQHLLSGFLPCRPTAPESAVHEWGEEQGIYQRCKKCGAYRNLASGSMPCPAREFVVQGETASIGTVQSMAVEDATRGSVVTEKVEKEPLEQDGHGWAEPPVSEEEGGRN